MRCDACKCVFKIFSQFSVIEAALWTWMNGLTVTKRWSGNQRGDNLLKMVWFYLAAPCCGVSCYKIPFCVLNACVRVRMGNSSMNWMCIEATIQRVFLPRAPLENTGFATGIQYTSKQCCCWLCICQTCRLYTFSNRMDQIACVCVWIDWLNSYTIPTRTTMLMLMLMREWLFCHRLMFVVVGGVKYYKIDRIIIAMHTHIPREQWTCWIDLVLHWDCYDNKMQAFRWPEQGCEESFAREKISIR